MGYNVARNPIGTVPNAPLASAPGKELRPPYTSACPAFIPRISRAVFSHHFLDKRSPGFLSAARHKSMIVRVIMYCETMFWQQAIYVKLILLSLFRKGHKPIGL